MSLKKIAEKRMMFEEGIPLENLGVDAEQWAAANHSLQENGFDLDLLDFRSSHFSPLKMLRKVVYEVTKDKYPIGIITRIIKGIIGFVAMPTLINHLQEATNDKERLTRIVVIGGPILQEFGLNILSLVGYLLMIVALYNRFPTITNISLWLAIIFSLLSAFWVLGVWIFSLCYVQSVGSKIGGIFLAYVMTNLTFGSRTFADNCGLFVNFSTAVCATANLWFAIQNIIWAIQGVNVLDPNVKLWNFG